MTTIDCDSLTDMLDRYDQDTDQESQGWFARHHYLYPIPGGSMRFQAVEVTGQPGGPYDYHWRVSAHVGATMVERRYEMGDTYPTPVEVRNAVEVVEGLLESARTNATAHLLCQLRETRAERDSLDARMRQLVYEALDTAVPKSRIADAAGVSRVTVDAWQRSR